MAYSWAQHPETTQQFAAALYDHIAVLSRFPYIGKLTRGCRGERVLIHEPYLIYYRVRVAAETVDILRIRNGSRR